MWTASLVSNLGGLVQTVGAGWLMVTLTTSPGMVALVQASTTLPIMLFSLPAGALADSVNRRRIMLIAQGFMLAVSAVLAITAHAGVLTPWLLLSFTFLIGLGTALNNPSWQASMGDIVPRDHLPAAVALNSMAFNLMRSVGPAIGGIIVGWAGAALAFAINALSYIPMLVVLARWSPPSAPKTLPREDLGPAIAAGLRYVSMSPNLLRVLARGFLFGLSAVCLLALLPLVARDLLQGDAFTYGVLLGCFGVGAIGGAFLNARLREHFSNETIVRGAFTGFALASAGLATSSSLPLSAVLLLPAGASWVLALSLFNVTVQLSTPRWVVGRALAQYQMATFGGMAGGSVVWGLVAEGLSPTWALVLSSVLLLFGALVGLRFGLPAFGTANLDPLDRFREPELRLDIKARSGPILIMIDLDIPQENVPAFLAVMAQRRRIRIRDGARQWTLLRDLEVPDSWTESYHVATWDEYLRHNGRRTQADAEITDKLLALHRGPERPRVHRMIERQTVPLIDDTPLRHAQEVP
jgi:MFS family permease